MGDRDDKDDGASLNHGEENESDDRSLAAKGDDQADEGEDQGGLQHKKKSGADSG